MSEVKQGAGAPKRRHRLSHQKEIVLQRAEALGSIRLAAQEAGVGIGTVYNWRRRFRQEGYLGLLPRPRSQRSEATPVAEVCP